MKLLSIVDVLHLHCDAEVYSFGRSFGWRFLEVSALKTLCGPYLVENMEKTLSCVGESMLVWESIYSFVGVDACLGKHFCS